MKETDLNGVKNMANVLLNIPYTDTKIPFIVNHPVFTTKICQGKENGKLVLLDISDEDCLKKTVTFYKDEIDRARDVVQVFEIIRKPYKLYMLKICHNYLSDKDFSKLLARCWTISENPNTDTNISVMELEEMFKKAEPEHLMSEEELQVIRNLPDRITVYRGVGSESNPEGLSWSLDRKTAEWFANRFQQKGYVLEGQIDKYDILAYFNTRNEKEVIVPYNKIIDVH